MHGNPYYACTGSDIQLDDGTWGQPVVSNDQYVIPGDGSPGNPDANGRIVETRRKDCNRSITWRQIPGKLIIRKYDEDHPEKKLKDVEFRITCSELGYDQTFKTDSNGEIVLNRLKRGVYRIQEISNPYYGYTTMAKDNAIVKGGTVQVRGLGNPRNVGKIEVEKVDTDTQEPLPEIKFKLLSSKGYVVAHTGEDKRIVEEVKGSITLTDETFSETMEGGTTFVSDSNGKIEINDVLIANYQIIEIENPHYGYKAEGKFNVKVTKGDTTQRTAINTKQTGNLEIEKVDADSNSPIEGVSFRIKNAEGYLIVNDKKGEEVIGNIDIEKLETGTVDEATIFTTDSNGHVGVYDLWIGTYEVEEISVGENYEYELDNDYITWKEGTKTGKGNTAIVEVTRLKSQYTTASNPLAYRYANELTFQNKKKYMKISGYVWEDISDSKTEDGNDRDSLYQEGTKDKLLKGIPVELKKANGEIADVYNPIDKTWSKGVAQTDDNGEYEFAYILIDDIPELYVEFEYNGMGYENVEVKINKESSNPENGDVENGNKASEGNLRTEFNNSYETITYQKSNRYALEYETSNHESKLVYGDKASFGYGYSGDEETRAPFTGVYEQYRIKANTINGYGGYLSEILTPEEVRKRDVDEFKNINLGLKAREEVDLSVIKDLQSVKVHINKENHVYRYADRFNRDLFADENNGYNMSPAVKFGTESSYGKMSYTRALYASDIFYEGDDKLSVTVTYKMGIKNISNLIAVVNEVVDYYDSKYISLKAGTEINDDGSIKEGSELTTQNGEASGNNQYQKARIKMQNFEIPSQSEKYIYVQLTVNPQNIIDILGRDKQEVKLDNIFEITSYSIKDQNKATYAAIDKNSQPENTKAGDIDTYENDTDKAPGMKLVLQEERKVSGTVFEDKVEGKNTNEIMEGQIRQGDGVYNANSGDKGIKNVAVTMKNANGEIAKVWNGNDWVEGRATTDESGNFTIGGFIPGEYDLVYTWGDKEYKVQDYKATIVDENSYNAKGNSQGQNEEWYKNEFKQNYPNVEWDKAKNTEIRRSDALDDYKKRQEIDNQTSIMTNENKQVVENYEGEIELENGQKQELIKKMDSSTPIFKVNIEYENSPSNARDEYKTKEDGTLDMNGIYVKKKEGKENYLRSIDFGIVERARQALELSKDLKNVQINLASGNNFINAEMENGQLKQPVNNTVFLPQSNGTNAQLKMEIDSELIEGAQLKIQYGLKVENISELDYTNEEFYRYGKGHGENEKDMVTLEAQNVIDYLDNNVSIEEEVSEFGEIIQGSELKQKLIEEGLLDNTKEMQELLDSIDQVLIVKDKLSIKLKPIPNANKAAEIPLTTSRLLANLASEDVNIGNSAEIIKIKKSGGSTIETTPGNHIPKTTQSEYDDDSSEDVTVVPPTGENLNYMPIILLSVSTLAMVTAGIILIKKFVLKK